MSSAMSKEIRSDSGGRMGDCNVHFFCSMFRPLALSFGRFFQDEREGQIMSPAHNPSTKVSANRFRIPCHPFHPFHPCLPFLPFLQPACPLSPSVARWQRLQQSTAETQHLRRLAMPSSQPAGGETFHFNKRALQFWQILISQLLFSCYSQ